MATNIPNPISRRIREKASNRRSLSLTDKDIHKLSHLKKTFPTIYTEEVPFYLSKTVSKAIKLAFLMVSDPRMLALQKELYQESIQDPSQTFRRIRDKAPHRLTVSLTDEDIQMVSDLEKTFSTICTEELPLSFSNTVSKAVELAFLMVLDSGMLFNKDPESIHGLSEEQKEQLKYMIENGVLYKVLADGKLLTDENLTHLKAILSANGGILFPTFPGLKFPIYSYRDIKDISNF